MSNAWRVLANMNMLYRNCLRSPAEYQGSCKQESPQFLATAESVRKKIADNTGLLLVFQHAYDQVDSSESSGIGSATAQAFLTDAEGKTDRTKGTQMTQTKPRRDTKKVVPWTESQRARLLTQIPQSICKNSTILI